MRGVVAPKRLLVFGERRTPSAAERKASVKKKPIRSSHRIAIDPTNTRSHGGLGYFRRFGSSSLPKRGENAFPRIPAPDVS